MGQRLTVDILEDGERIALIYYHWSSYFDSTIVELKHLKDYIVEAKKEGKDILLGIIEGLESNGGGLGIEPDNRKVAKQMYPDRNFTYDVNRNDGLLYLDADEFERIYTMNEGTASIDIDNEKVINNVTLEFKNRFKIEMFPTNPFKVMTFDQLDAVFDCIK